MLAEITDNETKVVDLVSKAKQMGERVLNSGEPATLGGEIHALREVVMNQRDKLQAAVEQQKQYQSELQEMEGLIDGARSRLRGETVTEGSVEELEAQIDAHTVC